MRSAARRLRHVYRSQRYLRGFESRNGRFLRKQFDYITRAVNELRQRWDNRLRLPLSKLGERYISGDVMVLLDLSADGSKDVVRNWFTLGICKSLLDKSNTCTRWKLDLGGRSDNNQFSMFIESVHVVDDAKRVINSVGPSLVRL